MDARTAFEEFSDRRVPLGTGDTLQRAFQTGFHRLGLHVSDSPGRGKFAVFGLNVVDTQAPVIDSVEASRACLWPPNHKFAPLLIGTEVIVTTRDLCDGVPSIRFTAVSSSQPTDGTGDGATSPDAVVAEGGGELCLRAERAGPVPGGRTYEATVTASDRSGNSSDGTVRIVVVHDERPSSRCAPLSPDAFVGDDDPRCAVTTPASGGCNSAGGQFAVGALGFLMLPWRRRARPLAALR